jgi:hypothetical protein
MIGQCIAEWARVDDELFRIFRDCVGPYEQCAIIYYRTPGLNVRLGLTDEIVRSVLPNRQKNSKQRDHPYVTEWKEIYKEFDSLLGIRRRIAHHPVEIKQMPMAFGFGEAGDRVGFDQGPFGDFSAQWPESWFEIYVSQHERLRKKAAGLTPLLVTDLRAHLFATGALSSRLRKFFYEMLTKPAEASLPPESPPQSDPSLKTDFPTKRQPRRRSSPL